METERSADEGAVEDSSSEAPPSDASETGDAAACAGQLAEELRGARAKIRVLESHLVVARACAACAGARDDTIADLRLCISVPSDRHTAPLPTDYSRTSFAFPHHIVRAGSERLWVIDGRKDVRITAVLRNIRTCTEASERELNLSQDVFFKLVLFFADTGEEVAKSTPSVFRDASVSQPKRMTNGIVRWQFRLNVLSSSFKPPARFSIKIVPVHEALARHELWAESNAFVVKTRPVEQASKKRKKACGNAHKSAD